MCPNVPNISATDSCSHNRYGVLHTYKIMLSATNTVLVLLVYKCAALLNTRRHTENKYPLSGPYIITSVRKMTS